MAGIKFEIEENFGIISNSSNRWSKELNLVSWNDRPAKFDIRDWDEDHQKMGKGITLSIDEVRELKKILNNIDL
ncbi:YdbC family protein [Paeniclostridium hominis]|uniref:YdbC family protein n=1 Tax=Paeniclostridium hominis TaxID=2764329 RepID=UPI0022E0BB51|nr:PC4/YdbC family ssDNA-binding protein [Paeniclostridium hominis]